MAADDEILHVAYPLVNDWALLLLVLTVVVGVYATYLARPSPLVHPLLLGRQSELSSTREKGSSGVYRSFAAGHGPPVRPFTVFLSREGRGGASLVGQMGRGH